MLKRNNNKYTQMEDNALVAAFCRGQHPAFEELYRRHGDPLYRFIFKQVNQQSSKTEEIFQDVWLSIIKHSTQFRAESKFSTYLYQLARNKVIDHARKAISHRESHHDNNSDEILAAESQQPDHKTQLEICIELLQQCIQKLPDEQKEAFILKQETEHTLEELAQITHTTIETIKSRLRYAMKKLREWLPGECL